MASSRPPKIRTYFRWPMTNCRKWFPYFGWPHPKPQKIRRRLYTPKACPCFIESNSWKTKYCWGYQLTVPASPWCTHQNYHFYHLRLTQANFRTKASNMNTCATQPQFRGNTPPQKGSLASRIETSKATSLHYTLRLTTVWNHPCEEQSHYTLQLTKKIKESNKHFDLRLRS
jgi:hypothetical protein